jgi:hypothetical protein
LSRACGTACLNLTVLPYPQNYQEKNMNIKPAVLFVVLGALASSVTLAANDAKNNDPAVFQAMKEQRIANLQEKLQIIQTHISCVQAGLDHAALKACHDAAKQKNEALETKIKAQKAEHKK